jgi:hypothetical protein
MSLTAESSGALEVLQTCAIADAGETAVAIAPSRGRLYIVPRPPRPCEYCGKLMENPRADQRFCRNPRHRRPHLVVPPVVKPCDFCGAAIEKPRRDQKFCRKPRRCASNARLAREYAQADQRRQLMAPEPAIAGIAEGARAIASLPELAPARSASISGTAPMIGILIESMPAPGANWPRDARAQWLAVLERTLDALYPEVAGA